MLPHRRPSRSPQDVDSDDAETRVRGPELEAGDLTRETPLAGADRERTRLVDLDEMEAAGRRARARLRTPTPTGVTKPPRARQQATVEMSHRDVRAIVDATVQVQNPARSQFAPTIEVKHEQVLAQVTRQEKHKVVVAPTPPTPSQPPAERLPIARLQLEHLIVPAPTVDTEKHQMPFGPTAQIDPSKVKGAPVVAAAPLPAIEARRASDTLSREAERLRSEALAAQRPASTKGAKQTPEARAKEAKEKAREKTSVSRWFKSVVTSIPSALKTLTGFDPAQESPLRRGDAAWLPLRELPILDGIPNEELAAAVAAGEAAVAEHPRDAVLDAEAMALLVVSGQVALAQFATDKLDAERNAQKKVDPKDKKAAKKEQKRRSEVGPLIRLAERNVAFFEEGDLVQLKSGPAIAEETGQRDPSRAYGAYAVTPIKTVAFARSRLDAWQRSYPTFAERVRRASDAARRRIENAVGSREKVADFFIRHGLSVALMLRVRQIDKCIECGACEEACEDRYGAKRLSLHFTGGIGKMPATERPARILGGLDFVDACHTCSDQRCIDPCNFDAIKFDVEKKEVVILEAACTGCTLCAGACPYAAIEMHDLDDKPLLKLRLEREDKLKTADEGAPLQTQFGEIPRRKAKLKRMASKCDHCIDYGDQACISACPTGALFDAVPNDVFSARSESLLEAAKNGFEHTGVVDVKRHLDPRPFARGLGRREADRLDRARSAGPTSLTTWLWVGGLGLWFVAFVEVLLRMAAPSWSAAYYFMRVVEGLEPELALSRVDYHPGSTFAVWLGSIGTIVMFSGMLYPARRRIAALQKFGSQRAWFDAHVMTGVVGPLFVLLHTAAKLDNWVGLGVWSMIGTVLSGLAGRYLFTQLGEKASAASLAQLDVSGRLDELRKRDPGVRPLDDWFAEHQRRATAASERGSLRALGFLLAQDLGFLARRRALAGKAGMIQHRATRREAVRLVLDLARLERRRILFPRIEPLFRRWKLVHVPMAIALTVIGGIHITLAIFFG